jgi:hypothetical protein
LRGCVKYFWGYNRGLSYPKPEWTTYMPLRAGPVWRRPTLLVLINRFSIVMRITKQRLWASVKQGWILCFVDSAYACNETNLMHYLSSVYSVTVTLHVSGLLVAHHEEVAMYVYMCNNWCVLYVLVDYRRACLEWNCGPTLGTDSLFLRFLDHTQRRNTFGGTLLGERSARRKDLSLTKRSTHHR